MNKKQELIEKIDSNQLFKKLIFKTLNEKEFNFFVNDVLVASKKYDDVKRYSIQGAIKSQNIQEYKNNFKLLRDIKNTVELFSELNVSEGVVSERSKKIIIKELLNIADKIRGTIDDHRLQNKKKEIRARFKRRVNYQFDIDYRALNSRPNSEGVEELVQDLFSVYCKHFLKNESKINLTQKDKTKIALKMSKFTSMLLQLLDINTISYSNSSDSLDLPSSTWSRLSKKSLKFIRENTKINN